MAGKKDDPQAPKISREFKSRLDRLDPEQRVRAIVMLQVPRQSGRGRQAVTESVRRAADMALPEIDSILERYDGKRLSDRVNALATISVETTPAGIHALADSEHVRAILEDQAIASLP
jgi:hypothetical protein